MIPTIAVYLIGICVGFILARLLRLVDTYFTARRIERERASDDEILCTNATVIRERTGEIAWIDNEKPMERM